MKSPYVNYPSPFYVEDYYYLPLSWIQHVESPVALDVMDALTIQVQDYLEDRSHAHNHLVEFGCICFDSERGSSNQTVGDKAIDSLNETIWQKSIGDLPALFSDNAYTPSREKLIINGLLRDPKVELAALSVAFGMVREHGSRLQYLDSHESRNKPWQYLLVNPRIEQIPSTLPSHVREATINVAALNRRIRAKGANEIGQCLLAQLQKHLMEEPLSAEHPSISAYFRQLDSWEELLLSVSTAETLPAQTNRNEIKLCAYCKNQLEAIHLHRGALNATLAFLAHHSSEVYLEQLALKIADEAHYWISKWPNIGKVIYRPRSYLVHRWPTRLEPTKPEDWGGRRVLLAFLYAQQQATSGAAKMATELEAKRSREELRRAYRLLFASKDELNFPELLRELDRGLLHLRILGLIEGDTDGPYTLSLERFEDKPSWPIEILSTVCQMEGPQDRAWMQLFRTLCIKFHMPINQLPQKYKQEIVNRRQSGLTSTRDAHDFNLFVQRTTVTWEKGPATEPKRKKLLTHVFEKFCQTRGVYVTGKPFRFTDLDAMRLQPTELTMPQNPEFASGVPTKKPKRIRDTQILIEVHSSLLNDPNLTVDTRDDMLDKLCQELSRCQIQIQQFVDQNEDKVLKVPFPKVSLRHLISGLTLDASHLQGSGKLDYNRPFRVLLFAEAITLNITLECRFRLTFYKAYNGGPAKSSKGKTD